MERTNKKTNERTIEWTSEQMLTIKCRAWVIYKNKWARMTSTVAAASASTRSAYITKAGSLYKQRVHRTHTHTHSLTYTRIYAYTIYMAGARASWEFDTHIWKKIHESTAYYTHSRTSAVVVFVFVFVSVVDSRFSSLFFCFDVLRINNSMVTCKQRSSQSCLWSERINLVQNDSLFISIWVQ